MPLGGVVHIVTKHNALIFQPQVMLHAQDTENVLPLMNVCVIPITLEGHVKSRFALVFLEICPQFVLEEVTVVHPTFVTAQIQPDTRA